MPEPSNPIQRMYDNHARLCGELALQWHLVHRDRKRGINSYSKSDEKHQEWQMMMALEKAVDEYYLDEYYH